MPNSLMRPHASRVSFLQRLMDALLIFSSYKGLQVIFDTNWETKNILAGALAVIFFLTFSELQGLYRSWRTSSLGDEAGAVFFSWLCVIFALLTLAFVSKTSEFFSRSMMITWWIVVPVILAAARIAVRSALSIVRQHGVNIRTVAVVGHNATAHRLVKHLASMPWTGLVIKGIFDDPQSEGASIEIGQSIYTVGAMDELMRKVYADEINAVYIALPIRCEQRIEELVNQLADTTASVYVMPDLFISELMHARWINFGGMPLVSVYETPFCGLLSWVKRLEDVLLSSLILLLISPLMIVIAAAVKVSSPGPVIFKQQRYGLNGALVEVWKFRSMTVYENGEYVPQAKKNDARITPLGAFLRKTSLDELPQFINVLQGRMSVVGPRPHAVSHNEAYRKLIKGYMLRHKVKPGITGWVQVNGWRGETDTLDKMQRRVEYDLHYIRNWSLWLDLKIVILTVFRGFVGENVY
ncbi:MAG: undecaprenyl-phosphate glucose phosphotransferase [Methylovulum sp.]|nr:MAG: undecaprenyl-phosphate glucose phosphotransferase [Methylovulum sp.]